jgi:hypothetical protein
MGRWQPIQRRDLNYILRNELRRSPGEIALNQQNAYAAEEDIDKPSYETAHGWHFYAYLSVAKFLQQAETEALTTKLVNIYADYTRAAKVATAITPDDKAFLLEHQGVLLHFYLDCRRHEIDQIIAFANILARTVKHVLFRDKEDGVIGFKMAAEFGSSVIIKVPSASEERSAHSRVSLGPCANDPAKKLLGNDPPKSWHFAYRDSDKGGGAWFDADCTPQDIPSAYPSLEESRANRYFAKNSSIEYAGDNPPEAPSIYYGFVFRADLDEFTVRVKDAFKSNDESAIYRLACDFISFMEDVNDWQENFIPGNKIIVFPWSGDCCNMVAYPVNADGKTERNLIQINLSDFPSKMIMSWNEHLVKKNRQKRLAEWTYSMASGSVKVFSVSVDDIPYRLMAGWPVGVSQEGVNLDGTRPNYLIMHDDDVKEMEDYAKKTFSEFNTAKPYKKQDEAARRALFIAKQKQQADATVYCGFSVPKSKPYSPLPSRRHK